MRRWLIWLAGCLLAVAAVFVVTVVTLGRTGRPSFDFLRDHEPWPLDVVQQAEMRRAGVYTYYYTFEADWDRFTGTVRKELTAKGFRELPTSDSRYLIFLLGDYDESRSWQTSDYKNMQSVSIARNLRYTGPGKMLPLAKGWVSVGIMGQPPKTFFDRAREWIGL